MMVLTCMHGPYCQWIDLEASRDMGMKQARAGHKAIRFPQATDDNRDNFCSHEEEEFEND